MIFDFFRSYKNSKQTGAILLVAGTTVGAGMLAMPLTAAGIGFLTSFILLCFMWGIMYLAALVQVNLFKNEQSGISFATLVEKILGKQYKFIPAIIKCLLFFGLLAAYISAGASVLVQIIKVMSPLVSSLLFSVVLGFLISMDIKIMEQINRVLVIFKFLFFIITAIILLPNIHITEITQNETSIDFSLLIVSIPIFFTAFGFHGSIPSLSHFLDKDQKKLKKVFFYGTIIPLATYILWMSMTYSGAKNYYMVDINTKTDIGQFLAHIGQCSSHPYWVALSLQWFSFIAFMTSFIGVGLGQIDYIQEILTDKTKIQSKKSLRALAGIITVGIPLLFALFYPNGFMLALAFAGFWLCILALLLPCFMAFVKKGVDQRIKIMAGFCLIFGIALFGILIFKFLFE
ncbi:MAG: Tyrosine-specific transport protein [Holosporales bacterium]